MGQKIILENSINNLKEYWRSQNITYKGNEPLEIVKWENLHNIKLPEDFKAFYRNFNGMETLYPSKTDKEGFLIYPLQEVVDFRKEFNAKSFFNRSEICFIFMNYLHKSWWYGALFSKSEPTEYSIVIIPDKNRFRILTNSLGEFIDWYIKDTPIIYEYE